MFFSGIVIHQTLHGGFRLRPIDELAVWREKSKQRIKAERPPSEDSDKKSEVFIENVVA